MIKIKTTKKEELIDITKLVEGEIRDKSKSGKGKAVLVYVPHTTCSVLISENADENICEDLLDFLGVNVTDGIWRHDAVDRNGAAHIKAAMIGASVIVPLQNGVLGLGEWQNIFLCEFDGPCERKVAVEVI